MANFDIAVEKTLVREGGSKITDDKIDRGGVTRYGISKAAFPDKDIANISERDAKAIYKYYYWDKIRGDDIYPQPIAESIFDFAVNAGVKVSSRLAQQAVGLHVCDGVIGPETVRMLDAVDFSGFSRSFAIEKIKYYTAICNRDVGQKRFYFGWVSRALEGL